MRAVTVLDEEDFQRFGNVRWKLLVSCDKQYATRNKYVGRSETGDKYTTACLHREIMGLEVGDPREVDHINGNGLDNRRENLRIVTPQQQHQNVRSQRGSTSRFRGVSRKSGRLARGPKPWLAQGQAPGGRNRNLGSFATEQEAAECAAAFRREHMPYATE